MTANVHVTPGVVELSTSRDPGIPGYMLTTAGLAVSSILPDNTDDAFQRLVTIFRDLFGENGVIQYQRKDADGYQPVGGSSAVR
jgi:hypothetical protein